TIRVRARSARRRERAHRRDRARLARQHPRRCRREVRRTAPGIPGSRPDAAGTEHAPRYRTSPAPPRPRAEAEEARRTRTARALAGATPEGHLPPAENRHLRRLQLTRR